MEDKLSDSLQRQWEKLQNVIIASENVIVTFLFVVLVLLADRGTYLWVFSAAVFV